MTTCSLYAPIVSSRFIRVDATYDLLLLNPTLEPEPGTSQMLIAGCLLLRAFRRKRDCD